MLYHLYISISRYGKREVLEKSFPTIEETYQSLYYLLGKFSALGCVPNGYSLFYNGEIFCQNKFPNSLESEILPIINSENFN